MFEISLKISNAIKYQVWAHLGQYAINAESYSFVPLSKGYNNSPCAVSHC